MSLTLSLADLGPLQSELARTRSSLSENRIAARIVERDHTVWKPDPTEISNRLGWLDSPATLLSQLPGIETFVDAARSDGLTHALLLGMGGSSLAPEVFRRLFGVSAGYLDLAVLDSTDPVAIANATRDLDPARTLFIAATKSGGTVETLSLTKYCYGLAVAAVGREQAGQQFVAITDPGSGLADLAAELGFRHTFLNDPDIGGRYAALSCFGMVPARLCGIDVERLLTLSVEAVKDIVDDGVGLSLGAVMGAAALAGRNKLTFVTSPTLSPVGVWIEQLIAESTGKEGKGILPVDGEPLTSPDAYGSDRLFVRMRMSGEQHEDAAVRALVDAAQPVADLQFDDVHDVGAAMFTWEVATIVASHLLLINPFDQPDVEAAKILARSMMEAYRAQGQLPEQTPVLETEGIAVYGDVEADSLAGVLRRFLADADDGAYLSLQAYVPSAAETDAALTAIRQQIRSGWRLATSAGYGPRYLHSTGQLHKGDDGAGLFLQITCDHTTDLDIPDEPGGDTSAVSFGTLIAAQALGDQQALLEGGRQVLRLHLGTDIVAGLKTITDALGVAHQT
ncbi:MAG TPA: glucose-6-phosphate isomerase [Candidatus Latescibacteria bacterium]|jgi:glucose-6-phosphate isomerase|nr:glucose-6-phosphate isomerase [Candidatus Latescibacterota bacterium]HJP33974.1 glucose-6-phosphate isomerase [Candidatus Latescibacterota bacterium]